jgi:hypothetical protein
MLGIYDLSFQTCFKLSFFLTKKFQADILDGSFSDKNNHAKAQWIAKILDIEVNNHKTMSMSGIAGIFFMN